MENLNNIPNAIPGGNVIFQQVELNNLQVGRYYLMQFDEEFDKVKVLNRPNKNDAGEFVEDGRVQTWKEYRANEWRDVLHPGPLTVIDADNFQRMTFFIPHQPNIIGGRKKRSRSRKNRKGTRKTHKSRR